MLFRSASTSKEDNLKGMLSTVDLATGPEKEELLAALEGHELYEQYLSGPFGTLENPVVVPSVFTSRIVGCVGGDGDSAHDLLWHEVKKGKPTICAECGQVFVLKTDAEDDHVHDDIPEGATVIDVGNVVHTPYDEFHHYMWQKFRDEFTRKED